jgi:putative ABC transport system permease protein
MSGRHGIMRATDVIGYGWRALTGYRGRTLLMLLAMGIGVAAVLMLTALGEGARQYVRGEFSSLGTNLVIVIPGRSETAGAGPATMMGVTPRDLTLDDARALTRHPRIERIAPLNVGAAEISWEGRKREVGVWGSTHDLLTLRHWSLAQGRFLPDGEWERGTPVAVIGSKVRDELFGPRSAIGEQVRIGDRRFRVIGVLASEGRSIGLDVDEVVIIPVASAQALFNAPSLFRILIEVRDRDSIPTVIDFVRSTIRQRHQGEEDVTVITQDAVLATFDRVLGALTYAVGGIAAISLAVAGILIMNVMLVAVTQRTAEIGLLKALGASARQILALILVEALLLSLLGGLLGIAVGQLGSWALRTAFPAIAAWPPDWAMFGSLAVALISGLLFSLLPARRAARLDPVLALARR